MRKDTITIDGKNYEVKIYFEERDNSTVSIGRTINIRIPLDISREIQFREIAKQVS